MQLQTGSQIKVIPAARNADGASVMALNLNIGRNNLLNSTVSKIGQKFGSALSNYFSSSFRIVLLE